METQAIGKTLVGAKIENLEDLYMVRKGLLPAEQVRSIELTDARVDCGASGLLLPKRFVAQLGVQPVRTRQASTIGGMVKIPMYDAVRLTVQGRDCICDVGEIPDNHPVVIGQVPLELMDWVIDPKRQRLIGNPAHGGEHMIDV